MGDSDLARLLAGSASSMQDEKNEQGTVDAVLEQALRVVPDASWVSITIRARRGRYVTLGSSDERARQADELQYTLGEGPCLESALDQDWVRSGVVLTDARWPRWGPRVAELGVGSLLSVAMTARGERIGALNLYADRDQRFADSEAVDVALLFAVHAAHAMAAASLVGGLEVAMTSRHDIGVAQGIIMERFGLSLAESFELLRRLSSQTNVKLAETARSIMTTGDVPTVTARDAGEGSTET